MRTIPPSERFNIRKLRKITEEQILEIKDKYLTSKFTCKELAIEYNLSYSHIYRLLKKCGIVEFNKKERVGKRLYTLDENYFDVLDTENKFYFLGLIAADGSISKNLRDFSIELQENDSYILDSFRKELKTNRPLYKKMVNLKFPNRQNTLQLNICNKHMTQKLISYGIPNKKSLILDFPLDSYIPKEMIKYYLRGYFDGNGSIKSLVEGNNCYVSLYITTTKMFADKLNSLIKELFDIDMILRIDENNITTEIGIYTTKLAIRFLEWIYEDSNIHLHRKYNKYLKCKEKMLRTGVIL